MFLISPHILANQSLFSISEGFLQSYEERQEKEQVAETHVQLKDNYMYWPKYLSIFQLDTYDTYQKIQIDSLNYQLSEDGSVLVQTQRGQVLGEYSILPPNFMNLTLYQKADEVDDVFGITQLPENLSDIVPSGEYTIEAETNVIDGVSVFYGYDTASTESFGSSVISDYSNFVAQNMGLKLNLLPGMVLNADFKRSMNESGAIRAQKGLNVAYIPGSYASFTAGYGVISKDLESLDFDSDILPAWGIDPPDGVGDADGDSTVIKQWGMALHPTDYSHLSADYMTTDGEGQDPAFSRAVFGLRFGDQSKELNATYQLESQENQQTTTSAGVEVGLVDLARLRAVYSKIQGPEEESSEKSTLDLGFNFNFAEYSSLDLMYKWAVPEEMDPDREQVAEAKLEIKF